jgi:hypothetical protein
LADDARLCPACETGDVRFGTLNKDAKLEKSTGQTNPGLFGK